MERIQRLLDDPTYQGYLTDITQAEQQRQYCRHGFDHALAVARIAYILYLEAGGSAGEKELVYAAGLLHDIGRGEEYRLGGDHAEISCRLAKPLLELAGFSNQEIELILHAIAAHRTPGHSGFAGILYRADKTSRDCRDCTSRDGCHWQQKNHSICY